jgi:predicted nucleic acid-binding protein
LPLILDSGGLLAAMDAGQDNHQDFVNAILWVRGPVIISPFVVAELDYMILREYGRGDQIAFLEQIQSGAYHLETFTKTDFTRIWRLVSKYRYLTSFGAADASNVVLAEKYGTTDILTTDHRDFRQVTTANGEHFRILPHDLSD